MPTQQKIKLGDLLISGGLITNEQLNVALKEQKKIGRKLGQTFVALNFVTEDQILKVLAEQLSLDIIYLNKFEFKADLVKKLPETFARRFRAIVLKEIGSQYLVGMADPTDLIAYDQIAGQLDFPIKQAIVKESELLKVFDIAYRRTEQISNLASELGKELKAGDETLSAMIPVEDQSDAPVAKLLQNIFEDAVQIKASDIHIEPDEFVLRIRQRVDGVLHEHEMDEIRIATALVLKLKLMAGLDISEKRLPQDGRFNIKIANKSIDVRLSTMPIQHGESVVMRLLDQSGGMMDITKLGMPKKIINGFRKIIHSPYGIVLVTGPTGSGKTTTLYSALTELNKSEKKIITAEDPVEYRLPRINQVQIQPKINLNFSTILRTALRQDPDIILVGEIRDSETAEIALRASMTGHLVLSTLHTNDATSTTDRLIDMGMDGYLLAATLKGILAQRLIRRLCNNCKQDYEISNNEKQWLYSQIGKQTDNLKFKMSKGCTYCNYTGYQGRIGVYELLMPNSEMLSALRNENSSDFHDAAAKDERYKKLSVSALEYVARGITSIEEIQRIMGEEYKIELEQKKETQQPQEGIIDNG